MHPHHSASTKPFNLSPHSQTTLIFQRSQDRLGIVCPVMFSSAPFIGEGIVHNLSPSGCLVECDRAVLQGSYIAVRVLLPDEMRSLIVDLAAVRWVRSQCFGIEFLRLPDSEHTRLTQFLRRHHG